MCFCRNDYIPGYIIPSQNVIVMSYGTGTKQSDVYDVLVSDMVGGLYWRRVSKERGGIPSHSVMGGSDSQHHEPLYIGRTCTTLTDGKTWRGRRINIQSLESPTAQLPGKVHLSHNCLYVGYGEREYLFNEYVY